MNSDLFEGIGKRVRKRRVELGFTQEYLAERMNVSVQMISGTEAGRKALKLENFIKLCDVLDVTADYLISGRSMTNVFNEELKGLNENQIASIMGIVRRCVDLCKNTKDLEK